MLIGIIISIIPWPQNKWFVSILWPFGAPLPTTNQIWHENIKEIKFKMQTGLFKEELPFQLFYCCSPQSVISRSQRL